MNKREARKAALRAAVTLLRSAESTTAMQAELPISGPDDRLRVRRELDRLADHLEWEADGRPERV
jgi:hypothetical protein